MLITEYYITMDNGEVLNRTYSNSGFKIERDGVLYDEAIDPADLERTYTETDQKIEDEFIEEVPYGEQTIEGD